MTRPSTAPKNTQSKVASAIIGTFAMLGMIGFIAAACILAAPALIAVFAVLAVAMLVTAIVTGITALRDPNIRRSSSLPVVVASPGNYIVSSVQTPLFRSRNTIAPVHTHPSRGSLFSVGPVAATPVVHAHPSRGSFFSSVPVAATPAGSHTPAATGHSHGPR